MSLAFTKLAVGVDCGGGAINLIALGRRFRHFVVIDELRLPEPLNEDAAAKVAGFLDRHRLREARAIACLPREAVLVRFLDLPVEAEPQLAKVVGYQLSALHPFKDDQVHWDCAVVGRDPKAKQVSVMVVLAEKSRVNRYQQALQELGLRLSGLTLGATALAVLAEAPAAADSADRVWPKLGRGTALLPPRQPMRHTGDSSRTQCQRQRAIRPGVAPRPRGFARVRPRHGSLFCLRVRSLPFFGPPPGGVAVAGSKAESDQAQRLCGLRVARPGCGLCGPGPRHLVIHQPSPFGRALAAAARPRASQFTL